MPSCLTEVIETGRRCLAALPYAMVADSTHAAAARIVEFESLNLDDRQGDHRAWSGGAADAAARGLLWWESAAAGGSSIAAHVLIGLAVQPELGGEQVAVVSTFTALHSLLDSLSASRRTGRRANATC